MFLWSFQDEGEGGLWIQEWEGWRSLQVEPVLHHQLGLSSCKENFVAIRGSHVVMTEQSLCLFWP